MPYGLQESVDAAHDAAAAWDRAARMLPITPHLNSTRHDCPDHHSAAAALANALAVSGKALENIHRALAAPGIEAGPRLATAHASTRNALRRAEYAEQAVRKYAASAEQSVVDDVIDPLMTHVDAACRAARRAHLALDAIHILPGAYRAKEQQDAYAAGGAAAAEAAGYKPPLAAMGAQTQ